MVNKMDLEIEIKKLNGQIKSLQRRITTLERESKNEDVSGDFLKSCLASRIRKQKIKNRRIPAWKTG